MKDSKGMSPRFVENRLALLLSIYSVSFLLLAAFMLFLPRAVWENDALPLLAITVAALYIPALFFLQSENGKDAPFGVKSIRRTVWLPLSLSLISAFALGSGGSLLYAYLGKTLFLYGAVPFPQTFSFLSLFTFVIVCPFCEEKLCRGLLQTHFSAYGDLLSIFASACLSSALCFSLFFLPFFFLSGLFLATVRNRTGSLFSSLFCAFFLRLGFYLSSLGVWDGLLSFLGSAWMAVIFMGLAIGLFLFAFFIKRNEYTKEDSSEEHSMRKKATITVFSILALAASAGLSLLI